MTKKYSTAYSNVLVSPVFCKVYLYLVLLPLWSVNTFLLHSILFCWFFNFVGALFLDFYICQHILQSRLAKIRFSLAFLIPRPCPLSRKCVGRSHQSATLSVYSQFLPLLSSVRSPHHIGHIDTQTPLSLKVQLWNCNFIPNPVGSNFPIYPSKALASKFLCVLFVWHQGVWLVLLLLSFTKFTRLKIPRGQWVRRPAVCPNHNYHSAFLGSSPTKTVWPVFSCHLTAL